MMVTVIIVRNTHCANTSQQLRLEYMNLCSHAPVSTDGI